MIPIPQFVVSYSLKEPNGCYYSAGEYFDKSLGYEIVTLLLEQSKARNIGQILYQERVGSGLKHIERYELR